MESLCDIIIPVWNELSYTKQCIDSIYKNTDVPFCLIIIDNGSLEETRSFLQDLASIHNNITLITNKENLGYVKAVNQGLKISQGGYVCLLNNDIVVTKDWLKKMIDFSEKYPDTGLINCVENWDKKKPYPPNLEEYARTFEKEKGHYIELDHTTGACLLIKRGVIEKIGYLDERFYMGHYEDNDYSYRAKRAGYRCCRLMDTYVWHYMSSSFNHLQNWREDIAKKNQRLYEEIWGKSKRILYITDPIKDYSLFEKMIIKGHSLAHKGYIVDIYLKEKRDYEAVLNKYDLIHHDFLKLYLMPRNILILFFEIFKKYKKYRYQSIYIQDQKVFSFLKICRLPVALLSDEKILTM